MYLLRQVVAFASYDHINTSKRSQRLTSPSTKLPSLVDMIKIFVSGTFSADIMLSELPKNKKYEDSWGHCKVREQTPLPALRANTGKQ